MTEDKNSLTENTSNTSSDTESDNHAGIYIEHIASKTTKWLGVVDFNLLREQRDELVVLNRKVESESLEGLINFIDELIDSWLEVVAT